MATMKAVRIHHYGGPETLELEDCPRPEPGRGEVLLRVAAAGVNPIDWKIREGQMRRVSDRAMPLIPGWDVSGTVAKLGPGASGFEVGEDVFTHEDPSKDGAYAQYTVVPAKDLVRKPGNVDHIHAAAVPLAALTAWQALFDVMHLEPGQTVLIHGAAGGVGHFAVQLANWRGAKVIATGSAESRKLLKALGVDTFIDYHEQRFEDHVSGVDAVLDTIGGDTRTRSWGVLRPGGILVSTVGEPSAEAGRARGVRGVGMLTRTDVNQLGEIARLIADGTVIAQVGKVLPLEQAKDAQEMSQSGHAHGKIVLAIGV